MKRSLAIAAAALAVMSVGLGIILVAQREAGQSKSTTADHHLKDPTTGLELRFQDPLISNTLTEQDRDDKFVFRLSSEKPAMLVSIRYEADLAAVAVLSKQDPLELLTSNAAKAYPQRFPEYQLLSERRFNLKGKPAAELIFTYKGFGGELAKQRQVIVIKNAETAVLVSSQSIATEFEDINKTYFDPIFNSLSFSE